MGLNPGYLLKSFLLYWIPSSHKVYSILMCQLSEINYGSHVTHFYHMALQILKLRNTQSSKWHPLIYLGIYSTLGCYLTMHVLGKIDSLTSFAQALYNISQRCQRLRLPRHIIYRVAKIGVHEIKSFKVEKILKGSLDSIPSPSVKIQIMGGGSLLEVWRQNITGCCQQTFCFQNFVDNTQQCFAFTPQANFPAHNLNFYWRWWDQIQATF